MRKIILHKLAVAATITFTVSSCSVFQKNKSNSMTGNTEPTLEELVDRGPNGRVTTMPVKAQIMQLDSVSLMKVDGLWTLRSINAQTLSEENGDTDERRPYINFDSRDTKFYAYDGCNTINGSFTAQQGDKLTLNLLLTTMALCPDAPYEHEFKQGLENVASFKKTVKDNENLLQLYNSKGSLIMTLVRPATEFLNGSWTVSAIDGKPVGTNNVKMVIDIPELKVHGNTGCNVFNGAIFVDPDKNGCISFQEVAVTRAYCPEIETETAFLVALESVEYARRESNGTAQLLNAKHEPVIELTPLALDNR